MSWQPDRLLRALLGWTLFTAALPTIITYRAGAQPLYEWGLYGISGRGIDAGYALVVVTAILAWTVVVLGYRGARRPFDALLVIWHSLLLASLVYGAIRFGDDMTLRGDAMQISINLAVLGPALGLLVLAGCVLWVVRHGGRVEAQAVAWRPHARRLFMIAIGLGIAIVVLFLQHSGHPHYTTDRAAIVLLILQVLVIGRAIQPPRPRAAPPEKQEPAQSYFLGGHRPPTQERL